MQGGTSDSRQPFSEHIQELRRRIAYSLLALTIGSSIGYALHDKLFQLIRQPLDAKLYYTSPIGGFNSMLKLSMLVGLVLATPVIIYQICQFLRPVFTKRIRPLKIILCSVILAGAGVSFAYFVSLPAAVHFLTHVDTKNLQPFLVVNDYLNFVFSYLAGFAILFQLPLILLFINYIKPQSPRRLMSYERYIIVFSFVIAAILTPTPDPLNQLIMAAPVIVLYQVSIVLIWLINRRAARKIVRAARTRSAIPKVAKPKPGAVPVPKQAMPPKIPYRQPVPTYMARPSVYATRPGSPKTPQPTLIMDIIPAR